MFYISAWGSEDTSAPITCSVFSCAGVMSVASSYVWDTLALEKFNDLVLPLPRHQYLSILTEERHYSNGVSHLWALYSNSVSRKLYQIAWANTDTVRMEITQLGFLNLNCWQQLGNQRQNHLSCYRWEWLDKKHWNNLFSAWFFLS